MLEDIKKLVDEKYSFIKNNFDGRSINENLTFGDFKFEIKAHPKEKIKRKSARNIKRDKKRMTSFLNKKNIHCAVEGNKCKSDMTLKEFAYQMSAMFRSMNSYSLIEPEIKTNENTDVFPICDPSKNYDNDITINDGNITVTEDSLCEGVKTEYFDELLDFTQSTLLQKGVCEDNVVLGQVGAYNQAGQQQ